MKRASCRHVSDKLRKRHPGVDIGRRLLFLPLPRRRDEPAHRGAIEGDGEADAAYACRLELRKGECDLPGTPTLKLKGLATAAHTAFTAFRSGKPGAINTSAPAFS